MVNRIHRFGDFRLVTATRSLHRGDEALTLPAKTFDCIVYLVEHRERAVGRDELIAAVWDKVDVSDGVLGQTILVARRALDDTGREQTMIRTLLRFGYQWVAPTATVEDQATGASASAMRVQGPDPDRREPPADVPSSATGATIVSVRPQSRLRAMRILGAALLLASCVFIAWVAWGGGNARRGTGAAPAMALVLPVAVSGEGETASWMRLGVMDLIATRLRGAGQAVVQSDNVVALAHGGNSATLDDAAVRRIATTAAARLVVAARAERRDSRWRVTLATRRGREPPIATSAESVEVLEAARMATDALATSLGLAAGPHTAAPDSIPALDTLLQKIEAALLVDDIGAARTLIEQADPALRVQPEVRYQQGHVAFKSGQFDAAQAAFEALLDTRENPADALIRGRTMNAFGAIAIERQDPAGALRSLDKAIELLGGAHAAGALGTALNNRAAAHAMARDYEAALADFAQARITLQAAGDGLGLAVSDSNLATLDMNRDRYAEAAPVLRRAIARFAAFHAYDAELNARANEVLVRLALLEPAAAAVTDPRLQELIARVADPARRATAQLARVQQRFANGKLTEARALLAALRTAATRDADDALLARVQLVGARDLLDSGQAAAAAAEADAARKSLPAAQDPVEFAANWLTLLRARIAEGQIDQAARDLAEAAAWAQSDGTPGAQLRLLLARAELEAARGHADAAGAAYEQALALADRGRVPADVLMVCRSYVAWLIAQRNPLRATVVAERASAWASQDYAAALLQVQLYHGLGRMSAWQSALARARTLAGERVIPLAWLTAP